MKGSANSTGRLPNLMMLQQLCIFASPAAYINGINLPVAEVNENL